VLEILGLRKCRSEKGHIKYICPLLSISLKLLLGTFNTSNGSSLTFIPLAVVGSGYAKALQTISKLLI
jgi:hypothetical protein